MKRNIIIDCDPGIDDGLAIILALSSEELNVVGITIVCGNAPVRMGFENAKKILKQMNRLDIPIYIGEDKPIKKTYIDALDTHGADGLGESFLPNVCGYEQTKHAVEFMAETLKKTPCSVIAIGPLTNLAKLIAYDEDAFHQIDQLISMGGNYRSHGNCSPVAEYNYWEDPEAASIVYEHMSKINKQIHMVGLDVTRKIVLTPTLLTYMKRLDVNIGEFIQKITKFYFDFHWKQEHLIGCVINDPLAIAYCIDPSLCDGFFAYTAVETDGITRGESVVDAHHFYQKQPNTFVLTKVNHKAFFYLLFMKLFHKTREELDVLNIVIE